MSRTLHRLGYKNLKQIVKPVVTATHRAQRLEWAREHSTWTLRNWRRVIFSDESSVELWKTYSKRQWRKPGQGLDEGYYKPSKMKFGKIYLKVWSTLSYNGVGKLIYVEDNYVGNKWCGKTYRNILDNNLEREGLKVSRNFLFQQDGDPVHTSKLIDKFFKEKRINKLAWPPCSSDMYKHILN
jgi:hypothetical protein